MSRVSRKSRQKITEDFCENCKKSWQNHGKNPASKHGNKDHYIIYYIILYILFSPQNSTFSTADHHYMQCKVFSILNRAVKALIFLTH